MFYLGGYIGVVEFKCVGYGGCIIGCKSVREWVGLDVLIKIKDFIRWVGGGEEGGERERYFWKVWEVGFEEWGVWSEF